MPATMDGQLTQNSRPGSGGWKSGIGCQHGWALVRGLFLFADGQLLLVSSRGGERQRDSAPSKGKSSRKPQNSPPFGGRKLFWEGKPEVYSVLTYFVVFT